MPGSRSGSNEATESIVYTGWAGSNGIPSTLIAIRGMVGDNFSKAVTGAIAESRRQWQDFRSELRQRYGEQKAQTMICSLTHDDSSGACRNPSWTRAVWLAVAIGIAVAVAVAVALVLRRRRRQVSGRAT